MYKRSRQIINTFHDGTVNFNSVRTPSVRAVMDLKQITDDFVLRYANLLNGLPNDQNALAPLRVSILCSQHIQRDELEENKLLSTENKCQYCLTSWTHGKFVMKTFPKHQNIKKKRFKGTSSFIMVIKCFVCLNVTKSEFKKNKILNEKPTKKLTESIPIENVDKSSKTSKNEEKLNNIVLKKKPKKKKKNLFAGLNPLVFKNRDLHKKKKLNKSVNL